VSVQVTVIKGSKRFGHSSTVRLEPNQPFVYLCKVEKSEDTSIEISLTELKTFESIKIKETAPQR
jgi:hypothetical protein